MTTVLVDADIVAFRCAASANNDESFVALSRVDELMHRILHETNAYDFSAYLTGSGNFRYKVLPTYKANRTDKPRPVWLQECREHLVKEWKASVSDGCEADDLIAIEASRAPENYIMASIDKDFLQIPGTHFNFVKGEFTNISPREGMFNFYWQLIMGDKSDNVFGYDGVARLKVPKFLESLYEEMYGMTTEQELFARVYQQYVDKTTLLPNGACLWLQRTEGDNWINTGKAIMEELGLKVDIEPSLPQPSAVEAVDGPPSLNV